MAYGVPPRLADLAQRLLPALLEADAEAGLHQPHVRAHEPADSRMLPTRS